MQLRRHKQNAFGLIYFYLHGRGGQWMSDTILGQSGTKLRVMFTEEIDKSLIRKIHHSKISITGRTGEEA